MLATLNYTFIFLILKKVNSCYFDEYKSISLCNCIYKIKVKIITMSINKILSKSISKYQFDLLDGRQIHEAIGVAIKNIHSVSIISKEIVLAFALIGSNLVWKVSDGEQVLISVDPWVGSGLDFEVPKKIINSLHEKDI